MCVCVCCRSGTSSPWGSASESDEEPSFRVSPARRSLSHYAREQLQSQFGNRGADLTSRLTTRSTWQLSADTGQPSCLLHLASALSLFITLFVMLFMMCTRCSSNAATEAMTRHQAASLPVACGISILGVCVLAVQEMCMTIFRV